MTPEPYRSVLPSAFTPSRLPARRLLALGGGLGCAAWSYAGAYPQFDNGSIRLVLMVSSLVFGALVSMAAVKTSTRWYAFLRGFGFAAVLGAASCVLPILVLFASDGGGGALPFAIMLGIAFGVPTGCAYGVPLGLLAAMAQPAAAEESRDRIAKAVGIWLVAMATFAFGLTLAVDFGRHPSDPVTLARCFPAMFAVLVAVVGVVLATHAMLRQRVRRAFLQRVEAGEEPLFRLREPNIVEWVPDGATTSAYRAAAAGIAFGVEH